MSKKDNTIPKPPPPKPIISRDNITTGRVTIAPTDMKPPKPKV